MNMQNTSKQFRLFFIALFAVMVTGSFYNTASAQDEEVTDEELRQYAMVMDSIDAMKANIQKEYNDLIQAEELMQGGRRFVEIQGAANDSVKLNELQVTDEELAAYDTIQQKYEEMTATFKENYTNLIKDELGGTLYNKITKALNKDQELKARYQEILSEVKEEGEGSDATAEEADQAG